MYVQVAHYRLGRGTVDELRGRVERGPARTMREVTGFVDYYAFDAGGGVVASVTIFADRTGLEQAERRLSDWIEQTISDFDISPGTVTEGEVFATAHT
jgi:hypothetical protein